MATTVHDTSSSPNSLDVTASPPSHACDRLWMSCHRFCISAELLRISRAVGTATSLPVQKHPAPQQIWATLVMDARKIPVILESCTVVLKQCGSHSRK
ncbi:hypothetical protein WG66_004563 [Moniliophthora roreri]|nr:hypothetical protein WG66_004563 [Moniliophthora roreri]